MSRIVLPVSRFDSGELPNWVAVHKHLRCGIQHDLHMVVPKAIESEAFDAAAALEGDFQSIEIHQIEIEPSGGWPYAPNVFFWHCAQFMLRHNPNLPWQLVEVDCLSLRVNSLDALSSQFMNSGVPFFGSIGPTPHRDTNEYLLGADGYPDSRRPNPNYGKIMTSPEGKGDVMMSGCGFYPGDLAIRPNFKGLMASFMQGNDSIDKPWDMFLRGAMRTEGMGHTDLIAQQWNTENYRIEDGRIVCDARDNHESQQPGWELRKCGGAVHPAAQMIHGVKDNSLRDLILNDQIPDFVPPPKRNVTANVPALSAAAPQAPQVAPDGISKSQVQDMLKDFKKDFLADLRDILKPQIPEPQNMSAADAQPGEPESVAPGIWPVVKRKLDANKWRLGDLSKAVSLPVDELKTLLESKGYEAKPPGMWIKELKAAMA